MHVTSRIDLKQLAKFPRNEPLNGIILHTSNANLKHIESNKTELQMMIRQLNVSLWQPIHS